MNPTPADKVLAELATAWNDWEANGGQQPKWDEFKKALAEVVGCSPDLFQPKVVRDQNFLVRLNETLMRDGTYPVMVCAASADVTGAVVGAILRSHIETHGREGVVVFAQSGSSPASFELLRLTALEHSPIAESIPKDFPLINVELVANHQSIRRALRAAADLQPSYVPNAHDPSMHERKQELETAASALTIRLNCSPTEPQITVNANAGLGVPAKVPYLRIFDPLRSPNAQTGVYVCVFVTGDGSEIVLSIQQGATEGAAANFKKKNPDELRALSESLHARLLADANFGPILVQLGAARAMALAGADGTVGPKAQNFSNADIASVTFPADSIPSDTELVKIVRSFHSMAMSLAPQPGPKPRMPGAASGTGLIAKLMHWDEARVLEVLESLQDSSPQVVLAGPPGTGKTFVSRLFASQILGVPGNVQDPRISFVQFHPTYGYEDFVEGLRPVAEAGSVVFKSVPGPIVRLSELIAQDGEPRVLIIDEINRANIARVFGELMYLLEYRDQKIDLMLQPDFSLPQGLHIIATMNTADKSTRVMDVALRRRFDFFQLDPDVEILRSHYSGSNVNEIGEELFQGFTKLNERLAEDLDRHRLIGHSYFMAEKFGLADLHARWDRQIEPLLQEYFFERQAQSNGYRLEEFWPSAAS